MLDPRLWVFGSLTLFFLRNFVIVEHHFRSQSCVYMSMPLLCSLISTKFGHGSQCGLGFANMISYSLDRVTLHRSSPASGLPLFLRRMETLHCVPR